MNEWNEGYFTDSTYTYGYYRELSPMFQNFCLLLRGIDAPKLDQDSRHCELGYGQGMSINIHAAATPGKYVGTDFNPAHAAFANELCKASGSGARLLDDSFEQLLERDDLPQFDSIGLHGIWSWISIDNQKYIVEFIRRHLKPGVVYNSYNCLPGWSLTAPLRELFVLYDKFVGDHESDTTKRVDNAIKFTEELLNANPLYAVRVPAAKERLKSIKDHDHNYLAHEYFNRDWICMYFSDVMEMLSAAKLEYACTAEPIDAIDRATLTSEARDFLKTIKNPIMREQARDYFVNRQFRKDIYVRGLRRLTESERRRRLLETRFVLLTTEEIQLKCKTPIGEANLSNVAAEPMLEHLRSDNYRPKRFDELIRRSKIKFGDFEQVVILLINNNQLAPCLSEEQSERARSKCEALNRYLCRLAETSTYARTLASPVTGAGMSLNRIEFLALCQFKLGRRKLEDLLRETLNFFEMTGERIVKSGKVIQSEDEQRTELNMLVRQFWEKRLPILRAIGIV